MNRIEEVEKIIASMSNAERVHLFQLIIRYMGNISIGIDSDPKICGGEAKIIRTRIPVWILVRGRQLGSSDADLLRSYPTLGAEDLANAWAYYFYHREEIENQIRENEAD